MTPVEPFAWLTSMVKHWTDKLVPDSQDIAADMSDAELWDQTTFNPYPDCYYEGPEIDLGFDTVAVRVWGDITSVLGPGEVGVADPTHQVDFRTEAGSYDGFEDWVLRTETLRYVKSRLHVDTSRGVPVITGMTTTLDSLERMETHTDEIIAGGGTSVIFDQEFHIAPGIRLTVKGTSALFATFETSSTTAVTIHVWNDSGTDIGGTVTVEAIGV